MTHIFSAYKRLIVSKKQNESVLFLVVSLTFIGIFVSFGIVPGVQNASQKATLLKNYASTQATIQKNLAEIKKLDSNMLFSPSVDSLRTAIPSFLDVPQHLRDVTSIASQNQFLIEKINRQSIATTTNNTVTLSIELTGDSSNVAQMVSSLESLKRLIAIDKVMITHEKDVGQVTLVITYRIFYVQ